MAACKNRLRHSDTAGASGYQLCHCKLRQSYPSFSILYVTRLRAFVFKTAEVTTSDLEPLRALIRRQVAKCETV